MRVMMIPKLRSAALATTIFLSCRAIAAEPELITAPRYKVGDTWTFDRTLEVKPNSFRQERVIETVERVDSDDLMDGVQFSGSSRGPEEHLVNLAFSERMLVDGEPKTSRQPVKFPMKIGATWAEYYMNLHPNEIQKSARVTLIAP